MIERGKVISRTFFGRCPNFGKFGMFKNWFRLNTHCKSCAMPLERDESFFYFGTTSIGYVLAILCVILPICILVIRNAIGMWTGVLLGISGSIFLCILLYPLLLSWVIMGYYTFCPGELPSNRKEE
jgi:uncharacterized protein (DUF983 family)